MLEGLRERLAGLHRAVGEGLSHLLAVPAERDLAGDHGVGLDVRLHDHPCGVVERLAVGDDLGRALATGRDHLATTRQLCLDRVGTRGVVRDPGHLGVEVVDDVVAGRVGRVGQRTSLAVHLDALDVRVRLDRNRQRSALDAVGRRSCRRQRVRLDRLDAVVEGAAVGGGGPVHHEGGHRHDGVVRGEHVITVVRL